MNVVVNGEAHEVTAPLSVEQLLHKLDIQQRKGIAIAKNMSVVPKNRWQTELLEDGDEVEIVRATQGG